MDPTSSPLDPPGTRSSDDAPAPRLARLPDEALVVRCGVPPFGVPTRLLTDSDHHEGVYGFSVQSAPMIVFEELARWCPNKKVGLLTVGEVRSFGYDVVPTSGRGHHATLIVPLDWKQEAAESLAQSFRLARNPTREAHR